MQNDNQQISEAQDDVTGSGEVGEVASYLLPAETRLDCLMGLASAFYWEQDADFRFTMFIEPESPVEGNARDRLIGRRRWDDGAIPVGDSSWGAHKADLHAHRPFRDLLYAKPDDDGSLRYISTSGRPIFNKSGRFRGYLGVARDITREFRALHLLKLEHAVSSALAEAEDTRAAFRESIRAICQAENFEAGEYWGLDEEAQVMRFYVGWCIDDDAVQCFMSTARNYVFRHGVGLVGWVWRNEQPLWIPDVRDDPRIQHKEKFRELGWRSSMIFPVTVDGQVIGVLDFQSRRSIATPDESLMRVIGGLGAQIGQCIQRRRAQELLRESEKRFQNTLRLAGVGIAHVATDGRFIYANPRLCEILGYSEQELMGITVKQISHPDDRDATDKLLPRLRAGEIDSFKLEKRYLRKDGSTVWVALTIAVLRDAKGRFLHDVTIFEDISSRKHAETVLRESEERFRALANLSSDWYWETDTEFRFTRLEGRYVEIGTGVDSENVLGKTRWEIGLQLEDKSGWPAHLALLESRQPFRSVILYRTEADGERSYFNISGEPFFDQDGLFTGYRGIGQDITERKRAESRIQYMANHDTLTDLPNRDMFNQLLKLAIESARRYDRHFAVLFVDLDRFKIINDTLGHEAGDHLLKQMSTRLRNALRSSDVVARLGGDEFVVMAQEISRADHAANVARKILSVAKKPIEVMGHECRVTASVGIAMFPRDAKDEQTLMKNADIAMYLAKGAGKNNFQFYSSEVQMPPSEKMSLEIGLRKALENDELSLHFQAKRELETGAVTGVEALLRWRSPTLGAVSPDRFIPVAEETGLIVPIGQWVLKTACVTNVAWQRAGLPPLCMAINISPLQFKDDALLGHVEEALDESGMSPQALELEITEGAVMYNTERALRLLGSLRKLGVRLAIDDFGTGYSSLAQLKRFPIDTLKIDRSFISELPQDNDDRAITEAIIAMGKNLKLTLVAEGVETEEQERFLRERGCDEMQGYYFTKPLPAYEFADFIQAYVSDERYSAGLRNASA